MYHSKNDTDFKITRSDNTEICLRMLLASRPARETSSFLLSVIKWVNCFSSAVFWTRCFYPHGYTSVSTPDLGSALKILMLVLPGSLEPPASRSSDKPANPHAYYTSFLLALIVDTIVRLYLFFLHV